MKTLKADVKTVAHGLLKGCYPCSREISQLCISNGERKKTSSKVPTLSIATQHHAYPRITTESGSNASKCSII
jgi:hypothetical protein